MNRSFYPVWLLIGLIFSMACQQQNNNQAEKTKVAGQKDYGEVGAQLLEQEHLGVFKIEKPAEEIIKKAGEPNKKSKLEQWGADGLFHQTWTYESAGIEVDMAKEENGVLKVNSISAKAPCHFKTSRNIKIGSSKMNVLKAYKYAINTADLQGNTLVAGSVYGGVVFEFQQNKVSSIFIGASAE